MIEAFSYDFMQRAVMAGLLASIACGVIGTLVVVNRVVFVAGGISHAAYGGVGLAFFLGLPVLPVTVAFSVAAAALMSLVTFGRGERADTVVGVLWAAGMAFGILLVDLSRGYNVDLMSFLFGSILAVPPEDLLLMACLDALVALATACWYRGFAAMSFDPEFAGLRGVPVRLLHTAMLCMTAASIVLIIRVVGLILVIALLTIPPYLAERRCRSLGAMMILSALYCAFFCLAGLALSYWLDLSSGASIIAAASLWFFADLLLSRSRT
ncbi:High-affinity zinc uptake system membrane protein ZnuB [Fundidesulfovibrio magnetotacticus]|uniref:High-affinity zinc uptake system membrane protein ZnuB n=1 Tax=Fundidesulfovibrio magnetotacticus TaxID=2730080 RepID=A0A6V8LWI7_9BACT|nr:metal ABC transporter permease [Fundidesulfovibrio magnetotacticus]GFK94638.1 High-affinity zinc uptake system membrane protein ZnuB [Fundidesulfovibrio magnetotacticus]